MQVQNLRIFLFSLLLVLAGAVSACAQQQYSYVYIQGDKETPFYVKLDGRMQERYGKNYLVIPQLVPGVINLEILFQQNKFPAARFAILVPDNGHRSFMITRQDGQTALYDLDQQFYLKTDNNQESREIAVLDVFKNSEQKAYGALQVKATDFTAANQYQKFTIDFQLTSPATEIEFRVFHQDNVFLSLDYIELIKNL